MEDLNKISKVKFLEKKICLQDKYINANEIAKVMPINEQFGSVLKFNVIFLRNQDLC